MRKHGIRLRLREQPCLILLMLLEHPGEVVLREEIRLRLWPNNTIVEFDHGINAAIQKLRDVLGNRPISRATSKPWHGGDTASWVRSSWSAGWWLKPPLEADAVDAEVVDDGELTGKTIAHYRILDKLGEGGMGVVYRAEDLKLGRQVALKFLPCPASELPAAALQRFEREARAIAALNHPHICQIYEVGPDYLAMELVEGQPLKGPIPLDEAMRLAGQIADALDAAHRKGITHRDLKPANILVTKSGVKLLDFGLAKVGQAVRIDGGDSHEGLTGAGTILGTLHYMSPEQVEGKEADARSDIFSFGLVLYEMITGRRAFDGDSAAMVMAGILEREAPALEPEGLNRVVRTCLAKDPDDRFQSARDLKRAIEWSDSGSWGDCSCAAHVQESGSHGLRLRSSRRRRFCLAAHGSRGRRAATPGAHHRSAARHAPVVGGLRTVDPGDLARRFFRAVLCGWWILGAAVGFSRAEIASRVAGILRCGILVRRLPVRSSSRLISDLIRIRVPEGAPEVIAKIPGFTAEEPGATTQQILIYCGATNCTLCRPRNVKSSWSMCLG